MGWYDDLPNDDDRARLMAENGIVSAKVPFSGGNDEGWTEQAEVTYEDGRVSVLPETWDLFPTKGLVYDSVEYNAQQAARKAHWAYKLQTALEAPVYARYGSFAGEFYVNGVLHVKKDGSSSFDGWETVSTEVPIS